MRTEAKRRAGPSQRKWEDFIGTQRGHLSSLASELASGKLTPREWADVFGERLRTAHADAWMLGRHLAGDLEGLTDRDLFMGQVKLDEESQYLLSFMNDVVDGRYTDGTGAIDAGAINRRSQLYAGKMRATSAEAWVKAGPETAFYRWVMLALEHCPDCPVMAANSPYMRDELQAHPGSGDTACLGNCKCILRREADGAECFRPEGMGDAPDLEI